MDTVSVRLPQSSKAVQLDASEVPELEAGDRCVVEIDGGFVVGEVVSAYPRFVKSCCNKSPAARVLRRATEEDVERLHQKEERERIAFLYCRDKARELGLDLKLVRADCASDGKRILFQFTSEGRVDFRALVRDLAARFHTRIEMRQIGVRDEARLQGGYGPCGKQLCCSTFLSEFKPVSVRMAKEQGLSLNPTKISGVCGRLMCCLRYELGCDACAVAGDAAAAPPPALRELPVV